MPTKQGSDPVLIADSSLVNWIRLRVAFASLVIEGFNPVGGTDHLSCLGWELQKRDETSPRRLLKTLTDWGYFSPRSQGFKLF